MLAYHQMTHHSSIVESWRHSPGYGYFLPNRICTMWFLHWQFSRLCYNILASFEVSIP